MWETCRLYRYMKIKYYYRDTTELQGEPQSHYGGRAPQKPHFLSPVGLYGLLNCIAKAFALLPPPLFPSATQKWFSLLRFQTPLPARKEMESIIMSLL